MRRDTSTVQMLTIIFLCVVIAALALHGYMQQQEVNALQERNNNQCAIIEELRQGPQFVEL